ncbi:MAG: hypothetical protein APF76_10825 [Desulfitibacter sp. BRH_c19]|nr:MAG: hypothetical protein APF76_10825 [Desulfitibacter sp. BRH_c19]
MYKLTIFLPPHSPVGSTSPHKPIGGFLYLNITRPSIVAFSTGITNTDLDIIIKKAAVEYGRG